MPCFRLFWDHWQAHLMPSSGYNFDFTLALILGSCYPCLYYGFYCEPHYRIGYVLLITLAGLGALTSFSYARNDNTLPPSGGLHCFKPGICKANPPSCANQSFHRPGSVQCLARLSLDALSRNRHPIPRNGLLLAPSRGNHVYHGGRTIVSLSPR